MFKVNSCFFGCSSNGNASANSCSPLQQQSPPSFPTTLQNPQISRFRVRAVKEKIEEIKTPPSADEINKKYGFEAGLWKIFSSKEGNEEGRETNKSKGDEAKQLLEKYGGAYLATSITLSLISFGLCYALINAGVDVPALLQKVGISTDETGEVGTFALAYAAHKAASPIRFPPTVALTPIVASWIGKKVEEEKPDMASVSLSSAEGVSSLFDCHLNPPTTVL